MPKNPNKQRVNPIKVTHVAWMTKDSEHGSKGRLIKLKSKATPMSKSHSVTSSPSNVSTPSKQIRSTPQTFFNGGFDSLDFGFTPVKPMRIPHTKVFYIDFSWIRNWLSKQTSNDYLREWLDYKDIFLQSLLNMEAPPDPRQCSMCEVDGSYRCSNCFGQPMFCMACCRKHHQTLPFHRIEQWTGCFFEESSLALVWYLLKTLWLIFWQ